MNTLQELMMMPWTWVGPTKVTEGKRSHWELRIRELPDFLVAGRSEREVRVEAAAALEAFLASYVDAGETPPLPLVPQWRFYVMGSVSRQPGLVAAPTMRTPVHEQLTVSGLERLFAGRTDLVPK